MVRTFGSAQELREAVGETLGPSDRLVVDQERIDLFADATRDHQWIHIDEARAKEGPFGTTIAHGYLTLSLIPSLVAQLLTFDGARMVINYGLNRVRFIAPVPVGATLTDTARIDGVTDVDGGVQLVVSHTISLDDSRPACVAETVSRVYF